MFNDAALARGIPSIPSVNPQAERCHVLFGFGVSACNAPRWVGWLPHQKHVVQIGSALGRVARPESYFWGKPSQKPWDMSFVP